MQRFKLTFLFDSRNDWLDALIGPDIATIPADRFEVAVSHDHETVRGQDVVFILGYTRILSPSFLATNRLNLVVHESDLPKGRGFAPVQWQILEGRNEIPICLVEAADEVDAGAVVARGSIRLTGYELYDDIRRSQASATMHLIRTFLDRYPVVERQPQVGTPTYFSRRRVADGLLDCDRTIREQFALLRIGNNEAWPSFFEIDGHRYVVKIFHEDS